MTDFYELYDSKLFPTYRKLTDTKGYERCLAVIQKIWDDGERVPKIRRYGIKVKNRDMHLPQESSFNFPQEELQKLLEFYETPKPKNLVGKLVISVFTKEHSLYKGLIAVRF